MRGYLCVCACIFYPCYEINSVYLLISGGIEGNLTLFDFSSGCIGSQWKAHGKAVTKVDSSRY